MSLTQSQALLKAIREYDASKWKVIGAKVGKPAKVCLSSVIWLYDYTETMSPQACEQYAKDNFTAEQLAPQG